MSPRNTLWKLVQNWERGSEGSTSDLETYLDESSAAANGILTSGKDAARQNTKAEPNSTTSSFEYANFLRPSSFSDSAKRHCQANYAVAVSDEDWQYYSAASRFIGHVSVCINGRKPDHT